MNIYFFIDSVHKLFENKAGSTSFHNYKQHLSCFT